MNRANETGWISEADLCLMFHLAPVGLAVLRNRIVQCCNEAFASMFGYSPDELRERPVPMLYPSVHEFEHIGARALESMHKSG